MPSGDDGRLLSVVSNGERAMVVLMQRAGDAGDSIDVLTVGITNR